MIEVVNQMIRVKFIVAYIKKKYASYAKYGRARLNHCAVAGNMILHLSINLFSR